MKKAKLPRSVKRLFPNLTKCADADEQVEVLVKQSDCTAAKRLDFNECAMARAAKRQFKADGACIGLTYSYLVFGNRAMRYKTPASVAREIVSFDRHSDFAPGDYKLSAPSPSGRLGARDARRKRKRSGSKDAKRIIHKETVRVRAAEKGA